MDEVKLTKELINIPSLSGSEDEIGAVLTNL